MKRIVLVLAAIALVLTLVPGLFAGAPAAIADSGSPAQPRAGTPDLGGVDTDDRAGADPSVTAPDTAPGLTSASDVSLIERLQAVSGSVLVSAHLRTGRARFIGADPNRPGFLGIETGVAGQPEAAARVFLAGYGSLFGVGDADALQVMKERTDAGRTFVRFQQMVNGIPVLGGELIVQVDATGKVWSASGEAMEVGSGSSALPATGDTAVTAEEAGILALGVAAKYHEVLVDALAVTPAALWYYAPDLLGAAGPVANSLVWRTEVAARGLLPIRELVLVDAVTGKIALHFNQIPHAKQRTVYDNQNNPGAGLPGQGPVRTEGQGATGNSDVDKAYDYAGDTYDFFLARHGRDSIDGAGLPIISTVRYCSPNAATACPYENAFWNGQQMVYGEGYASADDVVAHELTHGVTHYESQLFYYMQSGALNESFSDIWGEYVDQTNGAGNDSPAQRWQMGEDVPGGAIRNMANPGAFGDPDRVGSPLYWCDPRDDGGVHINSGVPNKATALMTDGGNFNGKTVAALGMEKVVRMWYRMATQMTTSAAEFQDVYSLLPQACTDLAAGGVAGIMAADCQQVRNALDATQMNQQPASCPATEAPVCAAGEIASYVYSEDFENQSLTQSRWGSAAAIGPDPWYYPQTSNPYDLDDLHYATSGQLHLWGDDLDQLSDASIAMTQGVSVPTSGAPYLRFHHAYGFEWEPGNFFDGGVMEYSVNNGAWTDAGSLFTHNGYDGAINSPFSPFNPLKGRQGFRALSWGYRSSRLNLAAFKGQSIRFRFRVGADGDFADWGWFIDDVRLYSCRLASTLRKTWLPLALR